LDSSIPNIKIIFFDLDDTLCGYWEASKIALRRAFDMHGPEGHTVEEMVQHWAATFREFSPGLKRTGWYEGYLKKGEPTRTEQMRLTLKRVGIDDEDQARRLSDSYAEERNLNLQLFADALQVLEKLKQCFTLGLITNGPADVQRQEIATLGIAHYFKHIYIEGEMGRGKPLPEVFEMIRQEVGVPPEQIVFVGNSYAHDVKPALEAGWHAIWVRRPTDVPPSMVGHRSEPESLPPGAPQPDATIEHLAELLPVLQ